MKKILLHLIAAIVMAGTIALGATTQAHAKYVNQADIDIVERATDAFVNFANESNDSTATIATLDAKAQIAADALRAVSTHTFYNGGAEYLSEAVKLQRQASSLADNVEKAGSVMETNDEEQISAYWAGLNDEAAAFDAQMTRVSDAVQASNDATGGLYLAVLIVTGVIALGSFLWAFVRPRTDSNSPEEQKARRTVALSSLTPLAGALITYVTFMYMAKNGGTYYVVWGLIIIGLVVYIRSIAEYARGKKSGFASTKEDATPPSNPPVTPAT